MEKYRNIIIYKDHIGSYEIFDAFYWGDGVYTLTPLTKNFPFIGVYRNINSKNIIQSNKFYSVSLKHTEVIGIKLFKFNKITIRRKKSEKKFQVGETYEWRDICNSEKGNSMVPLIKSGQEHKLKPCKWEDCKVKGNFYTHLVKAKDDQKGLLIGNNKGRINGWTKAVYGKVIEIL